MIIHDLLPAELAASPSAAALQALSRIYEEADAACAAFLASAKEDAPAFGCPEACGSCCEGFVPDMAPVEADFAALWILRHRPDLASVEESTTPPCPFYAADKPEAHCGIYGARPLICRLFGFSASNSKEGQRSYSLCREMAAPRGWPGRTWEGKALDRDFRVLPPLMADFGMRLQSISPHDQGPRTFLGQAIRSSLDSFGLRLSLARG